MSDVLVVVGSAPVCLFFLIGLWLLLDIGSFQLMFACYWLKTLVYSAIFDKFILFPDLPMFVPYDMDPGLDPHVSFVRHVNCTLKLFKLLCRKPLNNKETQYLIYLLILSCPPATEKKSLSKSSAHLRLPEASHLAKNLHIRRRQFSEIQRRKHHAWAAPIAGMTQTHPWDLGIVKKKPADFVSDFGS